MNSSEQRVVKLKRQADGQQKQNQPNHHAPDGRPTPHHISINAGIIRMQPSTNLVYSIMANVCAQICDHK
eukprot:scaffold6773_cov115-Skeletonema_dohrnii-CCMP3373.AAC.4